MSTNIATKKPRKITKTDEAWKGYIATGLRKTAEATLDTAKRIASFKANMSKPEEFQSKMDEWFNMSAAHLSYWSRINENMPRFLENIAVLPASTRTLYELSALDDSLWDELVQTGKIKTSLTVDQAKDLKTDGGIRKKVMAEYGDADNYLDIINKLNSLLENTGNIPEAITEFSAWIIDNPAEYDTLEVDDEPLVEPEVVKEVTGELLPKATATPVKAAVVTGPTPELRAKCLALFGIYTHKTIVDDEVLRFLDRQAGSDEAKLAAISTLEE